MILTKLPLFRFAVKKQVGQAGIIIDPESFRQIGPFNKFLHWFRNIQTFNDMQRHLTDFNRHKSHKQFVQHNNNLLDVLQKKNLRDLDVLVNEEYFKQIKHNMKHNQPLPINYNLFRAASGKIVQVRSFTDTIIRLKSIDQWYQVIVEYENEQKKQKAYHVLERFYKQKNWKFIKFNL